MLPDIPFCFSLKRRPLCQTLSNALDISIKMPLVLRPLSSNWEISWVIHNTWLMHESPGLNPDWLWEISSFSKKLAFWYKLSVLVFYHKQAATRLGDSFQLAVCYFFNELGQHYFFPFDGKFPTFNAWFKNKF